MTALRATRHPVSLHATYVTTPLQFAQVVGQVIHEIRHPDGRSWTLSGHTTTSLFLHLPPAPHDPNSFIDVRFFTGTSGAHLRLWDVTSSPWVPDFFQHLTSLLDQHLERVW
ncbi:hypothetical protein [Deinococcus sp. ME38]|uniref:hypothetical protein n=1 Tax=Deinococcus sp. ME38 TaxID=3400344 RepID=UPI003B5BE283